MRYGTDIEFAGRPQTIRGIGGRSLPKAALYFQGIPGIGQLAGAAGSIGVFAGGLLGALSGKGGPPKPVPVDLESTLKSGIAANLANVGGATKLASAASAAEQDIVLEQLKKAIPQYDKLQAEQLGVIEPMLKGEIPKDVQDQLQRSSAAYGVASGTAGSEFAGMRGLRNLGLTSLQLTTQGLSAADRWLARASQLTKAPTMSVSSMFLSGPQLLAQANLENEKQYGWQMQDWAQPTMGEKIGGVLAAAGGTLAGTGASGGLDWMNRSQPQQPIPSMTGGVSPAVTDWWTSGGPSYEDFAWATGG